MKRNLFELGVELIGISKVISGLSNQLDPCESDTLTPESLNQALFSLAHYIDRIADDIMNFEKSLATALPGMLRQQSEPGHKSEDDTTVQTVKNPTKPNKNLKKPEIKKDMLVLC